MVEPLLEKGAAASLMASAKKVGEDVSISVEVKDLAEVGNNIRLNMVLVEKEVRYQGGNKQKKHHHVVRSFPAGVDGIAMIEKNGKKEAKVNLEELATTSSAYQIWRFAIRWITPVAVIIVFLNLIGVLDLFSAVIGN